MNRKISYRIYLIIFLCLLVVISLPKGSTERLQGFTVALLAPFWNSLLTTNNPSHPSGSVQDPKNQNRNESFQKLQLENTLLREEIIYLKNVMQNELDLLEKMKQLIEPQSIANDTPIKNLKKRHRIELQRLLQIELQAIPARIIFRPQSSWNSSFWVNVGTATNETLGVHTIAKNSPVLVGTSVIGVIDYVGKNQSRVRLITDSNLTPSVRVVRSNFHDEDPLFLAKGEIHGSNKTLWRAQENELIGVGFNYDFADEHGSARDLRTGIPTDSDNSELAMSIVQNGDLLVTTGLDGVFPAELPIATVTKVHPLKEGDYTYNLDATPVAGNLDELSLVFIIPSVGYDANEH